jgi:hypothetical protein
MLDTTPVTTAITRLITTGTSEQALLAAVAALFPDLTPAELSVALQAATALPSGRWAVVRFGREPVEITSASSSASKLTAN